MRQRNKNLPVRNTALLAVAILNAIVLEQAFITNPVIYWWLVLSVPLLVFMLMNVSPGKHAILRSYPVIGHMNYFLKSCRDGNPFSRRQRPTAYQKVRTEEQSTGTCGIKKHLALMRLYFSGKSKRIEGRKAMSSPDNGNSTISNIQSPLN